MLGCVIATLPQQPAVSRCEGGMVCRSEKVDEPVTNSVLSRERKRRRISCPGQLPEVFERRISLIRR